MSENVLAHLVKKKEQVEYLLGRYAAARDNDFYLQYLWLRNFGGLKVSLPFIEWTDISNIGGQLESVRRVRQKIQNEDHKFLPSPEVQQRRRQRSKDFRKAITQF